MADIHDDTMRMIKAIAARWYEDYDNWDDLTKMFAELAYDLDIPLGGDE